MEFRFTDLMEIMELFQRIWILVEDILTIPILIIIITLQLHSPHIHIWCLASRVVFQRQLTRKSPKLALLALLNMITALLLHTESHPQSPLRE